MFIHLFYLILSTLSSQARALAAQLAETEKIRFVIGTQSLKQVNNQVHLIEFNEEDSTLKTTVCISNRNNLNQYYFRRADQN